ncbi:hypothetical protein EBZ38_13920 [bacterium]|nr:hypothetical protein [bacterium]
MLQVLGAEKDRQENQKIAAVSDHSLRSVSPLPQDVSFGYADHLHVREARKASRRSCWPRRTESTCGSGSDAARLHAGDNA